MDVTTYQSVLQDALERFDRSSSFGKNRLKVRHYDNENICVEMTGIGNIACVTYSKHPDHSVIRIEEHFGDLRKPSFLVEKRTDSETSYEFSPFLYRFGEDVIQHIENLSLQVLFMN